MDTINRDTIYKVKNRTAGMVVYRIPESNIRRQFSPGETKRLTYDELEQLTFQAGGRELLRDYLQVQAEEVLEELNIPAEPEYNMSEQDIANLMTKGSLAEFLDCLDFAPPGVIDLIKALAVSLPMNDLEKRDALKEKTGFDTTNALRHIQEEKEEEKSESNSTDTGEKKRRVTPNKEGEKTRRTSPKKYNIVSETEKTEE